MYEKQIDRVLDALAQVSPAFTEAYIQSMFWAGVNDVAFGAILALVIGGLCAGFLFMIRDLGLDHNNEAAAAPIKKWFWKIYALVIVCIIVGNAGYFINPTAMAAREIIKAL